MNLCDTHYVVSHVIQRLDDVLTCTEDWINELMVEEMVAGSIEGIFKTCEMEVEQWT